MSKTNFRPIVKSILLVGIAIGLLIFAFIFESSSQYHSSIWAVCALPIFLLVIALLRLIKVSWSWSVLGGSIFVAIFSILGIIINYLVEFFITGWLMD